MTSLLLHNSDVIANGNPVLNHFWVTLVDHTACKSFMHQTLLWEKKKMKVRSPFASMPSVKFLMHKTDVCGGPVLYE